MYSRLTRWVNRLLPFSFKFSHIPETDMGFTDLLSRLTPGKALSSFHYDEEFVVASIEKILKILYSKTHFNSVDVNIVDRPPVAVNNNTLVNTNFHRE